jgi:hypothetical protein
MSQVPYTYDTPLGGFALICRHCRKTLAKHVGRKCLFDSSTWDPMTDEEWHAWRKDEHESFNALFTENSVKEEP